MLAAKLNNIVIKAQPFQCGVQIGDGLGSGPFPVRIFNPENELTAVGPGEKVVEQGGADTGSLQAFDPI